MDGARRWLTESPAIRETAVARFTDDPRRAGWALPDALLGDPSLLVDIAKEVLCEAIRQDAPVGVAEALLDVVRRMTVREQQVSPRVRELLVGLRGLRDPSELLPVLTRALAGADAADRSDIQRMVTFVEQLDADAVTGDPTSLSPADCAACCALSCIICLEFCAVCCLLGCLVC